MRGILLLCFFLPLLTIGQEPLNITDPDGLRQGLWRRNYPNGRIMYEGRFINDKPVGEWKRYHDNGFLRAILTYGSADTVNATLFDETGKKVAVGNYNGEKKVGLWTYFSDNKVISEDFFVDGLKSGTGRIFYPEGTILEESEWKDGSRSGRYRALFPSGNPFLECMYADGRRHGYCITYYPSGEVEVEASYSMDLPDGEWKYYTENGDLKFILIYQHGLLMNPEMLYKMETKQLEELEKKGRQIADPEKFLNNPMEYMMRNP